VSVSFAQLLHRGHAHNDYLKQVPLFSALEAGLTSIEVDIYDVKGEIRVAHIPLFLKNKPLLKVLYFEPLAQRIKSNGGTVFKDDSTQLILMIELKRNHPTLLNLLRSELESYNDLIDIPRGENKKWGPIKILLTGGVYLDLIKNDEIAFFSLDGGWNRLKKGVEANFFPRISMNYASHFTWKGRGDIPADELEWLKETIKRANELGCELRFWNMPNKEVIWKEFLEKGVHRINVDKYEKFSRCCLEMSTDF